MTPNSAHYALVRIRWLDSGLHQSMGWSSVPEHVESLRKDPENMLVDTVGMLVYEVEDVVIVAQSLSLGANETVLATQVIAKESIVAVHILGCDCEREFEPLTEAERNRLEAEILGDFLEDTKPKKPTLVN